MAEACCGVNGSRLRVRAALPSGGEAKTGSSLWAVALLQVLGQGDAHHEVQPGQAGQGL